MSLPVGMDSMVPTPYLSNTCMIVNNRRQMYIKLSSNVCKSCRSK